MFADSGPRRGPLGPLGKLGPRPSRELGAKLLPWTRESGDPGGVPEGRDSPRSKSAPNVPGGSPRSPRQIRRCLG
eukprot:9458121-Alexandrium_andersonii.AAC.1